MRWILIILLLLMAGLQYRLWLGQGSWEQITRLQRDIAQQSALNKRLLDRNQILEHEVSELKNGLNSIEARARKDLGLIKQGETFYLLVDDEKQ